MVGVTEDGSDGTINSKNLYSSAENFGWSGKVGDLTHELTIPVTVDGTYHVKYVVKDLAENGGDLVELEAEFILDTKSPEVLEYKFTGPEARNGKYYNDTRTLKVVVKDLTFDTASKAVINQEYGSAKQSDWEETGAYTFTKTIEFKEDGIYSFVLTLKDLAGIDTWNNIYVIFNGNREARTVALPEGNTYTVVCEKGQIDETGLRKIYGGGNVKVSGQSAMIIVR